MKCANGSTKCSNEINSFIHSRLSERLSHMNWCWYNLPFWRREAKKIYAKSLNTLKWLKSSFCRWFWGIHWIALLVIVMAYRLDRFHCNDDVLIISKASNVRNQILAHCKYMRNKLVHSGELDVSFVGCVCVFQSFVAQVKSRRNQSAHVHLLHWN